MMPENDTRLFAWGFSPEECNRCGKCLAGCAYSGLSLKQASEVMRKVTADPGWHPELAFCIRCGKCDHRCPRDARPSSLMRECLAYKRRGEPGVSASMAYGINGLGPEGWGANFFKDVYKGLGKLDREILKGWAAPKKSRDLIWVGCTDRMMPRNLEESHALKDAAKFGGPDDCCGVWALQAGLLDEGYRVVKRLLNRLRENSFERLVVGCGHCQKVFTRMMPEMLGIELPFPMVSIYEYLLEQIESGAAPVTRPVLLDAAISDPCFGYENGEKYLHAIRSIAGAAGMTLTELPHNKENSLCCGYGGLYSDGRIARVVRAARIKRKDLAASGQKHVVSYCPGCHLVNHYFQPGYGSHYLLEEVLHALGDSVPEPFSLLHRRLARPHIAWNLMGTTKSAFWG
jgi:Fe-S oxidoreductase